MRHRFGNYELDEASAELRHAGRVVEIQPKPLALLALLVRERSRVVPTRELLDALWPDTQVTLASLTRAVSHARRAIGDTNRGALIRSVSRRGYRFCGDVLELDRTSAASEAASAGRDPALLFVGREEALGRLEDAFAAAVERRGGVALVTGRAGIGKTRLVEHFAARTSARGARVLFARNRAAEGVPAFWLWVQVMRQLFDSSANELGEILPELSGAKPERFHLFDAVARALATASRRTPLLIALEDLQWADTPSLRLLEHLAFEAPSEAILVLGSVREEFRERGHPLDRTLAVLRQQERTAEVALAGFSRREVGELLARVLGQPAPSDLISELFARTEGVPLFLREAIRLLGERGVLEQPENIPRAGIALPGRALDLIQRALTAVSARTAALVAAGAVLGRDFTLSSASELAQLGPEEALDLVDEATRAGVLEASPDDAASWRFSHALFQEAAYAGLAAGERVRLHLRAAERLEREHKGALDAVIAELAHHHNRALAVGDPARAFACARAAAEQAAQRGAWEQAARHYEQAVAALAHVRPVAPEERLAVLLELGEICRLSGERTRRRDVLTQAMALARTLGRTSDLARAAIAFLDLQDWGVRDDAAWAAVNEALAAIGSVPGIARARLLTRRAYFEVRTSHEAAQPIAREAVALARGAADPEALQDALYVLHFALSGPDHIAEREHLGEEIVRVASESKSGDRAMLLLLDLAADRLMLGDAAGAAAFRARADAIAGDRPATATRWQRGVYDTGLAILEGKFGDAAALARETFARGVRVEHPYARAVFNGHRAMLAHERGDAPEVLAILEPTLGGREGPAHWVQARVARSRLAVGRESDARALFESLARVDFADLPRHQRWMSSLIELAMLCAELGDTARARVLHDLLAPVEHLHGVLSIALLYGGPVRFALARLAETLGRSDDAQALYAEALDAARAVGARPMQARIALHFGRFVAEREPRRAKPLLDESARLAAELGMAALAPYSNESARR